MFENIDYSDGDVIEMLVVGSKVVAVKVIEKRLFRDSRQSDSKCPTERGT